MNNPNHTPWDLAAISPRKAWQAALGELQLQVTADTYEMYLHPARFLAYEDGTFLVAVPNGFVKDWLEIRLNRVVKRTLRHIISREVEVKYTVQTSAPRGQDQPTPAPLLDLATEEPAATASKNPGGDGQPLVADYTFTTFIVGANNRMAHAGSMAVADQPGGRYNPLFIYSGVGLGKTHLLHAIGHRIRRQGRKAMYVSCEVFTNELVAAIRTNTQEQFRARYRTSDLLFVDDVQFLVGKPSTQEELFHTFNALYESGRQIVLACDRPPKDLPTLESRLRSRFEWGLIADIHPPDLETRLAILQAKVVSQGLSIPYAILEKVALMVLTNVRELEGALTRVSAYESLSGRTIGPEMVESVLADLMPRRARVEPARVLELVADQFDVTVEELMGARRMRGLVRARQVAMFLLRQELDLSFAKIGVLCGGRDHATAIHSVRKVAELLETDSTLGRHVDELRAKMMTPEPARVRMRGSP